MNNNTHQPKRLKPNKKFVPSPQDDGDEFYPNGIFEFNISKLLSFIKMNSAMFPVEEIVASEYAIWEKDSLDEVTVEAADVNNPILIAEISPGRFNVIDGNHRLEKARRMGLEKIRAYRVSVEHHISFLTSEKAYQAYIKYWNSKVDAG